ncbi:hypothetical protein ACFO5R_08645 [Halosolutus amylolyticus]|uniref:Uncharacterized protein n=1 Tax=Halosolutus amylolyticus TaxID=2932267 RepID=A0ABD5PND4_9EURY|nr:hypothetical protein [Halosolutus amylolyticus]
MFPPPFSNRSIVSDELKPFTQAYRDVVIYDDTDADDPLYEGPIVVHPNGWLELEGQRLLSPAAVHHIDIYDDAEDLDTDHDRSDGGGGDDRSSGDDHRTNRFSPR